MHVKYAVAPCNPRLVRAFLRAREKSKSLNHTQFNGFLVALLNEPIVIEEEERASLNAELMLVLKHEKEQILRSGVKVTNVQSKPKLNCDLCNQELFNYWANCPTCGISKSEEKMKDKKLNPTAICVDCIFQVR